MQGSDGANGLREPNIVAHHFHGLYGSPGTDDTPCNPPPEDDSSCWRGDNIFNNILPGTCSEYQYDVPLVHAPGTFW